MESENAPLSYLKLSDNLDRSIADIHSYGYDVHEVHTSEGGARIVQTHGTGLIHDDESAIQQTERSLNQQRIHSDRSVEHQRTTLIQEQSEGKRSRMPSSLKSSHKEVGFLDSARSTVSEIGTATDHNRKTIYTLPSPSGEKTETWQHIGTLPVDSYAGIETKTPSQCPLQCPVENLVLLI
uniref:Late endosomal/lysosomal adaptor and MAPK and MTOR activator 1 n=1 Tax=Elaeophora elaphi TaxID=1147741 RepID=A0A0R3RL88_9BILA